MPAQAKAGQFLKFTGMAIVSGSTALSWEQSCCSLQSQQWQHQDSVVGFKHTVLTSILNYMSIKRANLSKDAFICTRLKMEKISIVHTKEQYYNLGCTFDWEGKPQSPSSLCQQAPHTPYCLSAQFSLPRSPHPSFLKTLHLYSFKDTAGRGTGWRIWLSSSLVPEQISLSCSLFISWNFCQPSRPQGGARGNIRKTLESHA